MIRSHSYLDFFRYPVFRAEQQRIIEKIENGARLRKFIMVLANIVQRFQSFLYGGRGEMCLYKKILYFKKIVLKRIFPSSV